MAKEKWMQEAKAASEPGYLHRATGTPAGQNIPKNAIAEAANSQNPRTRRAAALAKTYAKARKK